MPLKRALVVDDSRSARAALRKLLEEHSLDVAEAESGEMALEFLSKEGVDVIFMDHTMPGMDGLEAVSAIKTNPATATIPVMMYTTKEGEVYVGQARALGAVGVLPKNVQPHQLFEMLLHLGLVSERRGSARAGEGAENLAQVVDEVDRALEDQALGMSVQALVTRILEDQHLTLRSDILRSQKSLAKQVAHEILKEQALAPDVDGAVDEGGPAHAPTRSWFARPLAAVVVVVAALVGTFLAWQFKSERDAAYRQLVALETGRANAEESAVSELEGELASASAQSGAMLDAALQGFANAAGLTTISDMREPAFSAELAEKVGSLIPYLQDMGFTGEMTLTSHLGRFCLVVDEVGEYQSAPGDMPMLDCHYNGHVLEDNRYASDRLSVEFSRLLRLREGQAPTLELVALDAPASVEIHPYPGTTATAGEWNERARLNNRVEISFQISNR